MVTRQTWLLAACLATASCGTSAPAPSTTNASPPAQQSSDPSASVPADPSAPPQDPPVENPLVVADNVKVWLDDPRLAKAKEELAAGHGLTAARIVHDARPSVTDAEKPMLAYLEGALFSRAGAPDAALAAFRDAAEADTVLKSYALMRAAETSAALGKHELAISLAAKIDTALVPRPKVDAATIESLARAGSVADTLAAAERLFGPAGTRPPGWALLALRVAKALANKPDAEHARAGIAIANRIMFDAPRGRGAPEAEKLAKELIGRLGREEQKSYREPTLEEQADRGRRMADADPSKRSLAVLDKIVKASKGSLPKSVDCTVAVARGKALGAVKRKRESYDETARGANLCEGDALAGALLAAGRAAAKSNLHTEAMSHFGRFEAAFPKHAQADDARLEGAREALEGGDLRVFRSMLASIDKDYPDGDKVGDALFELAMEAMERGDFAAAKAALERGALRPRERVYARAGRFPYFLGRALAGLGDRPGAAAAYEKALVDAPLSYYAALAASRLDDFEPGRSQKVIAREIARGPAASPAIDKARMAEPAIAAALTLAGLADPKGVDDALAALGVKDHTAPAAFYLFGARLLALAGDQQASHQLLRTARERDWSAGKFDCDLLAFELPREGDARQAWELSFPRMFSTEVDRAAAESGVPAALIYAVMREESSFLPKALSVSDARGLMQVIPPTGSRVARGLGLKWEVSLLYEPEANVRIGAKYLSGLRTRFGDARALAIAGYNAGPGAPAAWVEERPAWELDLWVERIPYSETKNYVKRVWSSYFVYQILYGDGALGEITASSDKVPEAPAKTKAKG